jgi:hypothetical protein
MRFPLIEMKKLLVMESNRLFRTDAFLPFLSQAAHHPRLCKATEVMNSRD